MNLLSKRCGCGDIFALPNLKSRESRCAECCRKQAEVARATPRAPVAKVYVWKEGQHHSHSKEMVCADLGIHVWCPCVGGWHWNDTITNQSAYYNRPPGCSDNLTGPFDTESEARYAAEKWATTIMGRK